MMFQGGSRMMLGGDENDDEFGGLLARRQEQMNDIPSASGAQGMRFALQAAGQPQQPRGMSQNLRRGDFGYYGN